MHALGHPAHVEPLLELHAEFGIRIFEDAAEALSAVWIAGPAAGRTVGTVGDIGCFSFNGKKTITSGGGGVILTADPHLARHAKHLTIQAKIDSLHYHRDAVGYNYRLNVSAAIGLAQLERLHTKVRAKRAIASGYDVNLAGQPVDAAPHALWCGRIPRSGCIRCSFTSMNLSQTSSSPRSP